MVKDLIKLEVSLCMGDHDNPHNVSNYSANPNSIINIDIIRPDSFIRP